MDTNLCTHTNTCASEWGKLLTAGVFKDTNLCKQTEMCASEWGKLRIAGVFVDTYLCTQTNTCVAEWPNCGLPVYLCKYFSVDKDVCG